MPREGLEPSPHRLEGGCPYQGGDAVSGTNDAADAGDARIASDAASGGTIGGTRAPVRSGRYGVPMAQYVALLRGINVGGNNRIKMPELRRRFEELGFGAVATHIQSGNVLFEAARRRPASPAPGRASRRRRR